MSTPPKYLRIYVNGTLLENRTVHEVRDVADWVTAVHIETPDYELTKRETA